MFMSCLRSPILCSSVRFYCTLARPAPFMHTDSFDADWWRFALAPPTPASWHSRHSLSNTTSRGAQPRGKKKDYRIYQNNRKHQTAALWCARIPPLHNLALARSNISRRNRALSPNAGIKSLMHDDELQDNIMRRLSLFSDLQRV